MTYRSTARATGVLFIFATASGGISLALQQPHTGAADPLAAIGGHQLVVTTSAVLTVLMAAAIAAIPIVLLPVLQQHSPRSAVGYIAARAGEGLVIALDAVAVLVLVALAGTAAPEAPALAELVTHYRDAAGHAVLDIALFPVGALILNSTLFRFRLVPRWLSIWGLVAAGAYLLCGLWVVYGLEPLSPLHLALMVPLAVEELTFALWLILRGFTEATPAEFEQRARATA